VARRSEAEDRQLARKILNEGLALKKGEALTVETWNNGLEFARLVVAEARSMGVATMMILEDEEAYIEGVRRSPRESLGVMGKQEYAMLSASDAYLFIPGPVLGAYSKKLKADESSGATRYNSSWYEAAEKANLRGARLVWGYAGTDLAKMLGKPVADIVAHQKRACAVDLGEILSAGKKVAAGLDDGAQIQLGTAGGTLAMTVSGDLTLDDGRVDGDDVARGDNMAYWPPGMVTKQVDPTSVAGKVALGRTLTKYGVIDGVALTFRGGTLASWKAKRGSDSATLEKLFGAVAPEKRRVTVMMVGLNPKMKRGFGQDRFVKGAVSLAGFGFTGFAEKPSLTSNGKPLG
jgi:leucyl aminopeptidase (aminopeptidase T)